MKIIHSHRFLAITTSLTGILWLLFNNYFLPFHPWTTGLVRPWFMLHGLIPYRDFVWIRMPADLFMLSWWYRVFGTTSDAYQFFIAVILLLTFVFVYLTARIVSGKRAFIATSFYALVYPLLFLNTEVGELLIGLFSVVSVYIFLKYVSRENKILLMILGFFCGLLIVTKQNTALFSLAMLISLYYHIRKQKKSTKILIKRISLFTIGLLFLPALLTIYYVLQNAFDTLFYYTVTFLFSSYTSAPVTKGNGLILASGLLVLVLPFILSTQKDNKITRVVIISTIISLIPTLYPSFLSYRTYPLFPLIAVTTSCSVAHLWTSKVRSIKIAGIILFSLSFLILKPFLQEYSLFVEQNGFIYGQLLTDYGKTEETIADWITKNTTKEDKIMVYTNSIIYLWSDRLPTNKYVDPFPYILQPYSESTVVFESDPPDVFVYNESLPEVHTGLDTFPFIANIKREYTKRFSIDTISIYQHTN